jgi:N-acetylglucosaminyldiphosphoundecaprenol N-acetyl-beta-D-mannosaminyltransferase
MPTNSEHRTIELAGVRVHLVDRADVLAHTVAAVERGGGGNINNVNVHAMNTAWRDPLFREILNASDLVFVDGAGVRLGACLIGRQLGERLTPADWIDELLDVCAQRGWPVYWLGDTDEVGEAFERCLMTKHPALRFAGRHHGFFAKEGPQSDAVVEHINASGAKVLMVGMSMPVQEKWVWANRERLRPAVRLALGGLARIITGHIRRGPRWMTENGLEWLYRLAVQPRYTWRRYLIGNPLFLLRLVGWHLFSWRPVSATKPFDQHGSS